VKIGNKNVQVCGSKERVPYLFSFEFGGKQIIPVDERQSKKKARQCYTFSSGAENLGYP